MRLPSLPSFLRSTRDESISGLENPSVDVVSALVAHQDGISSSGVSMTPMKAFRLAAVYACVRVIAESVASLPIEVTERDSRGDGRQLVADDPRFPLLNEFPNPEMTGVELVENWIAHALLWGVGYLFLVRTKGGAPLELWPLRPDVTQPMRTKTDNRLYYTTQLPNGKWENLLAEDVVPIKALMGISPVLNTRDMLATAAAAQEYAGRFWANNARPGGVIELPESMEEDEMDDFIRRWKAGHEGLKRSQLVGILSGGAKWTETGIPPATAQFIETRQFGTREIARMYGVPLHRVADAVPGSGGGSGAGNSLEQQSIEFVTYTLRSWIVRGEQVLRQKLFAGKPDISADRKPRFNFGELMRGDVRSRYEAYAIGIQWGILNRAEPRRLEGLPAAPDDQNLEDFLIPLNMLPSAKIDEIDVNGDKAKSGGGGKDNKDGGGTQPTTGSDGSTPQRDLSRSLALLSGMMRDDPELAEFIGSVATRSLNGNGLKALPATTE